MSTPLRIEKLFAWVATHKDGTQGIPAMLSGTTWIPMVGADRERIESLRGHAMGCLASCASLELVEFTGMEVLEAHAPQARQH